MSIAYTQAQDTFSFNVETYDFGDISESGGRASCDFILYNDGKTPLTITNVKASCGCTTPNWTKEPIGAGKTGTITVAYNPKGRPGKFNKSVTVTTDAGTKRLYIKGMVTRNMEDVTKEYPYAFGDILLKQAELVIGDIDPKQTKTVGINVFNKSESPITVQLSGLPAFISYKPISIQPKSTGRISLTIDASKIENYGSNSGSFQVNNAGDLKYKANLRDSFSHMTAEQKANAGKINLSSTELAFTKKITSHVLKISNSGKSNLTIKAIQTENPTIKFSKTTLIIKPGEIAEVKIEYPVKKLKEAEAADIYIYSDDPNNPAKIVKAKAVL